MNVLVPMIVGLLSVLLGVPALAAVTADFEPSRTECVSPCVVYFDATEDRGDPSFPLTRSSGNHDPYHDLHYEWSFGDPSAGTWSTSGKPRNVAYGPQAAHLFEIAPGSGASTFTVTLEVSAPDGSSDTVSKKIAVSDPDQAYSGKTVCVSRDGSTSGCPSGATRLTNQTGSFDAIVSSQVDSGKRRILFKRGQTWKAASTLRLNDRGPGTIGAFGSGADPVIDATHGDPVITCSGRPIVFEDWRLVDLRFDGGGGGKSTLLSGANQVKGLALIRVSVVPGTFHAGISLPQNTVENAGGPDVHHDISIVDTHFQKLGFGSGGNIGFLAARRIAFLGNRWIDATGGEHVLRVQYGDSIVIAHNILRDQSDRKAVITIRSLDPAMGLAGSDHAQNVIISDNSIGSTTNTTVTLTETNKSIYTSRGRDVIFERNYCYKSGGDGPQMCLTVGSTHGVTVRNNIVQMDGWKTYRSLELGDGNNLRAYNNSCYTKDNPSLEVRCVRSRGDGLDARNNVLYAPNATRATAVAGANGSGNLTLQASPFVSAAPGSPEDFRPRSGSPLLDAGNAVVSNRIDFASSPRSSGTLDVGAFEQDGGSSPPALAAPFLH